MRIDRTSGGMSPGSGPTTHVAQEGETLASIASDFGVSAKSLAKANRLPEDAAIQDGQELVIPTGREEQARTPRGVGDVPDQVETGAVPKAFIEGAAPKAFIEGAAPKAFIEGAAPKAFIEGAVPKAFIEGAAPKAFIEGAAPKAFIEGAAPKAFIEGAAPKAFIEGAAPKAFIEGAASKAFVEGAASKAFVEGAASKAFVEGGAAFNSYQIQKGDTMRSVADQFGVTAQELAKANGMRSNARLTAGQELKVPVK